MKLQTFGASSMYCLVFEICVKSLNLESINT